MLTANLYGQTSAVRVYVISIKHSDPQCLWAEGMHWRW